MSRWERFWWAHDQAESYGFWFAMGQAWRFAMAPGRIHSLSRQVKRDFARTVLKEHQQRMVAKLTR